jgi:hypothetical protein
MPTSKAYQYSFLLTCFARGRIKISRNHFPKKRILRNQESRLCILYACSYTVTDVMGLLGNQPGVAAVSNGVVCLVNQHHVGKPYNLKSHLDSYLKPFISAPFL